MVQQHIYTRVVVAYKARVPDVIGVPQFGFPYAASTKGSFPIHRAACCTVDDVVRGIYFVWLSTLSPCVLESNTRIRSGERKKPPKEQHVDQLPQPYAPARGAPTCRFWTLAHFLPLLIIGLSHLCMLHTTQSMGLKLVRLEHEHNLRGSQPFLGA